MENGKNCHCRPPRPVVERTAWKNKNPGRRFKTCNKYRIHGGCNFFEWIDPPMCHRAKVVIPGLLRKIGDLETEITSLSTTTDIGSHRQCSGSSNGFETQSHNLQNVGRESCESCAKSRDRVNDGGRMQCYYFLNTMYFAVILLVVVIWATKSK
ncbi:uncharacterized protein LOC133784000 [Humulus lupulus]|uniref:uncharacterized protein LOC133784000 n=1 Tax=Humulus lupulus TaxID=3486 RepID=UPI002B417E73|nr:uncharacterized protein LOC133784000 [Humulus lupulus]